MFDTAKHPRDLRGEFRRSEMALHVASRVMAGGGNVRPDLADSPGRSSHGRMRNYAAMTDAKLIGVLTGLTQYGKDPEAVKAAQAEAARRTGTKIKETTMDPMDRRVEHQLTEFGLHLPSAPHIGGGMFKEQLHPRQHGKFAHSYHPASAPVHHHSRWVESDDKSDAGIEELHAHAREMDRKHGTTHEFHDPRVGGHKFGASVKFHGSRAQLEAVGHSTRQHYANSKHSPRVSEVERRHDAQEAAFKLAARQRLSRKGLALPDGSYPIQSEGDLANAVKAFGRAKDKARAKAHIVKRAKALGATSKLPKGWLKEAELLDEVEGEMIAEATLVMDAELREAADSMAKAHTPEPFSKSKTSNWVARGGGLPDYIQHVAHGLVRSGHSTSEAIKMAIGIVRRWARGGGKVDAQTKAAAALAISQWEDLKAKNAAKKAA